jgi:hypothetical protein
MSSRKHALAAFAAAEPAALLTLSQNVRCLR